MYRNVGNALLRAARAPVSSRPDEWPDLTDDAGIEQWRAWLAAIWSRTDTAEAVRLASPTLARRLEDILAGTVRDVKGVRRATVSVVRYLLRETARPTPFGLFAGTAPIEFGPAVKARWGDGHRPMARVDAQWLTDVVRSLEACPELLERLPVTVTNLRSVRGDRVALPSGPRLADIRRTSAVRAVECAARAPIRFAVLVVAIAERFSAAAPATVRGMLAELVAYQFLITCLRPPATITDPLGYVLERLDEARADEVAPVASTVRELRAIHAGLDRHNHAEAGDRTQVRAAVAARMHGLSGSGRTPLAVDLWLDCDVTLPERVARDMEAAAGALLRLTGQPGGPRAWRDYYAAFIERYGVGAMVRLHELVDPDVGIGLPAGYPGSLLDPPGPPALSDRDDRLMALVHRAALHGYDGIVLDDDTITGLAAVGVDTAPAPPHVELSARLHAASPDALERGEFTLTVSPARAAGTMTGRFTAGGSELAEAFRTLPTSDTDAIPAQLSFPPAYPHAENVTRTPRFLPYIIALGEHHGADDGVIPLDDLAVTADRHRLRLIWLSQGRPVEPQVFHALAMDKQAPTVARFLSALSRAHTAFYTEFDWGAAARLTYLPRVRYRRAILSAARWRLDAADLPPAGAAWPVWRAALDGWRQRWRLPGSVELRDDDRVLRLDLDQPAHLVVLRAQLQRVGHAALTEAGDDNGYGWLDGHAHEIAVPLVSTRTAAPSPLAMGRRPALVPTGTYGHLPGSPESRWLFAKLFVHPGRQAEVIAAHLPRLLAELGNCPQWWFVRYRSPHEGDHLRLRLRVDEPGEYAAFAAAVGVWAQRMRRHGLAGRLVLDTYYPELGRYGAGPVLAAAEQVFAADSQAVLTQLQLVPDTTVRPDALAVANLVDIARGFCGGAESGMAWLIARAVEGRPAPAARAVLDQAVALADPSHDLANVRGLPSGETLIGQWVRRREMLNAYRRLLPDTMDPDDVLESLLHMHQVRAVGIDRDRERRCRRLARAVALGWQARRSTR